MIDINLNVQTNSACNACSDTLPVNGIFISKAYAHNSLNYDYVKFTDTEIYNSVTNDAYVIIQIDESTTDYCKIERKKLKSCEQNLLTNTDKLPVVIRIATQQDIEKINEIESKYAHYESIFRTKVKAHNLEMKFIATHMQFDKHRLFFYYTAETRVDFRALAKDLASEFKTRIELRQISYREETRIKGGIGTCGRELCCSTFLDTLKRIPTQIAFDQNITFNISKISGVCGKLKCCLLYEFDEEKYQEILKSNNFHQALQESGLNLIDTNNDT